MNNTEVSGKILLVDDEMDILDFIEYNLNKEGFDVKTSTNGKEAISIVKEFNPDVVLLDVMMPEMDGIETCHQIRELDILNQPIIAFLTARGEDYSQIAGFDAGADDYITKPVKPRVLISRIKALMRRGAALNEPLEKQTDQEGIVIDRERYLVIRDGETLSLPKKEFELLALLMSKPGKVFGREKIMSEVWGNDIIVGDRTIDVHIRKLREKIGEGYISTVKGVGYKIDT